MQKSLVILFQQLYLHRGVDNLNEDSLKKEKKKDEECYSPVEKCYTSLQVTDLHGIPKHNYF